MPTRCPNTRAGWRTVADGPGLYLPDGLRRSIAHDDPMPPPPFAVGLTLGPSGWGRPYTVRSMATGQAVAGHVESRQCADGIAAALNGAAARGLLGLKD